MQSEPNNNEHERNIFQEKDHKGRPVWVVSVRWPDNNGRFRQRVGRGKKPPAIAYSILAEINTSIWNKTWPAVKEKYAKKGKKKPAVQKPVHHTIATFAAVYTEKYVPTLTTKFNIEALKPIVRLVGTKGLREFTMADAEEYRDLRAQEVERSTVNKELNVLSGVFSYAQLHGYIDRHPTRVAARQKNTLQFKVKQQVRRLLTPAEVRLIIEKTLEIDYVVGTYIAILAATGLRKQEGLHLKRYFFDCQNRELVIEASKNFKPRPRPIPLTKYVVELYEALPWISGCDDVFVRLGTGKRLQSVRDIFTAGKRAAGITWPGLHDFRRYRITQWLRDDCDLDYVRDWVGHASIKQTAAYLIQARAVGVDQARRAEAAEERQIEFNRSLSTGRETGDMKLPVLVSSN